MQANRVTCAVWIVCAGALCCIVSGCHSSAASHGNRVNSRHLSLAGLQALVPKNFLSGDRWCLDTMRGPELAKLLSAPMPQIDEVPQGATVWHAIEQALGRQVIWMPPLGDGQLAEIEGYK